MSASLLPCRWNNMNDALSHIIRSFGFDSCVMYLRTLGDSISNDVWANHAPENASPLSNMGSTPEKTPCNTGT